jgi:hypothetical protein
MPHIVERMASDEAEDGVEPPETGRRRRFAPEDDLLSGFDRTAEPDGLRAFFATTIGGSLLVWDLTFTLGAYHTVFYSRLFQILVVSTVLLLGSILLRDRIRVRPWMRAILAIPLVWLLFRMVPPIGSPRTAAVVDDVFVAAILATLPFTMFAVARILAPEYFTLPHPRLKATAIVIIVLVGAGGLVAGQFNYQVTTCHDYTVAGNNTPSNCRTGHLNR